MIPSDLKISKESSIERRLFDLDIFHKSDNILLYSKYVKKRI